MKERYSMRIMFIGDIMGKKGRRMVQDNVLKLKAQHQVDVVIANAENAAHGRGLTQNIYQQLLVSGVDVMTMGNHTFDNATIFEWIDEAKRLVRPANLEDGTPGYGLQYIQVGTQTLAVLNVLTRTFMDPVNNPFCVLDTLVKEARKVTPYIFVDVHGETTSEKQALGWFLDGRVSAVYGTHTHVQTNDARLLHKGTAYLTDVGMTGPYDGIIGIEKEAMIQRYVTGLPKHTSILEKGRGQLGYAVIDVDKNGIATDIEAHILTECEARR